ncbi:transporter [candidate division KSB1 bacterium]|nr:transporter [candidate division KSB1 bacterium]
MRKLFLTAAALVPLILPTLSLADNNARDYIAAPAGTTAMITYWQRSSSNLVYHKGDKVDNSGTTGDIFILRPVHWMNIGPVLADPQMLIIGGNGGNGAASGLADPIVLSTFWAVNNAASKTWLGLTPFITLPIGEYHPHSPGTSMGGNRWVFKPEIGFVQGFGDKFYLDLTASVSLFAKNNNFGRDAAGDKGKLEQDPLYALESHLSYDFNKSFFGAIDYYGHFGGETKVNGTKSDNKLNNHTVGLTGAYGIAPGYQLMLTYTDDISVYEGRKANTFTTRFLHVW